jgi:hypothetical protein
MRYVPFVLVLIALILGACQPNVPQPANVAPEQEAAAQQKAEAERFVEAAMANEDAFQSGDVDRIIEFYAEDAVSMPPGFPVRLAVIQ